MQIARFINSPSNRTKQVAGAGLALVAAVVLATVGCQSGNKSASQEESSSSAGGSVKITAEARAKAQDLFSTRCAACHGLAGKGDGAGAANLTPKPPNFQDKNWQASITDQNIDNAILYGGAAIGKSPMMPANPDLQSQPAVVAALREKIRQLGK
jgi:cytochrome c